MEWYHILSTHYSCLSDVGIKMTGTMSNVVNPFSHLMVPASGPQYRGVVLVVPKVYVHAQPHQEAY